MHWGDGIYYCCPSVYLPLSLEQPAGDAYSNTLQELGYNQYADATED